MLDAKQRSQRSRVAALTLHASGGTNTTIARAKAEARFREEVLARAAERGETLTEEQIARRAAQGRQLFYARIQFASLKARRKNEAPKGRKTSGAKQEDSASATPAIAV